MTDLLDLTAELIDIPSVSHHEQAITDHIEAKLRAAPWLSVERLGDNVLARTNVGHSMRVVRTSIEATVLLTGFLLGGTVGVGTVVYALLIGPITHQTIPALAIRPLAMPAPATPAPPRAPAPAPAPAPAMPALASDDATPPDHA